jgi:hypothetical protein
MFIVKGLRYFENDLDVSLILTHEIFLNFTQYVHIVCGKQHVINIQNQKHNFIVTELVIYTFVNLICLKTKLDNNLSKFKLPLPRRLLKFINGFL